MEKVKDRRRNMINGTGIQEEKKKLKWLRVGENKYFPNLCHPE
jgi:hypothetical protein